MNTSGRKTAASDIVIERMVKLISRALSSVAFERLHASFHQPHGVFQKHDGVVHQKPNGQRRAIRERLSRLYPNTRMAMIVSSRDRGSATAGINVSVARPRNTKDHGDDQHKRDEQSRFDVGNGIDDRLRAIVNRRDAHRSRQLGADDRQQVADALGHLYCVRPGLAFTATTTVDPGSS